MRPDHTSNRLVIGALALSAGAALWRWSAGRRADRFERQARTHYAKLAAQTTVPLHPVRWGNRVLVERQAGDARPYAETYLAQGGVLDRLWWQGGAMLLRVPGSVWYGLLGACAVVMGSGVLLAPGVDRAPRGGASVTR
ncbi:MAG: hypothetical protein AAF970_19020 [Bacteroidota bacterium]